MKSTEISREDAASCIVRLIDLNVDDLYADAKTHAAMSARNQILWDRARALAVDNDVCAVFSARLNARMRR